MMKITIAAPAYPYRGGIAEFSNRLARQFSNEGHDVNIITFTLQYPEFLFPGKTQYTDSPGPQDLSVTREMNSVNPLSWFSTGRKIKKDRPDILLLRFWLPFMGPCLGTIARIARSNHYTRVICIFDNVVPHEKRPGDRILTKYFTGSVDAGIVMAKSVGDELRTFRKNMPVILNPHPLYDNYGIPVSKEAALNELKLDKNYKYLLFFGFIRAYKGLDLLIESLADKRIRDLNIRLLVAGEFYEDAAPYRELIKKHNLDNEILLFDRFVNDQEIPYFFGAADLVVQPYRNATQSGVTQVAYYYEKPMIVTNVGGLSEIVPDKVCGYVIEPEPFAIASSILDFFGNKRSETFIGNIKREKMKFSWSRMTETIIKLRNNAHI
jgi:glycosyltransferase involved in cell wall biosynthesis